VTVSVADFPCTLEKPAEPKIARYKNTRYLRNKKDTPDQSATTVIEATFYVHPDKQGRYDGELWLHENCGSRQSAEHDLGRIVISENEVSEMQSTLQNLKVKLDISEEGLLCRKPILEMQMNYPDNNGWIWVQMPITWESSSPCSLSNNNRMEDVRVQLADEMKMLHST
jgi:hypothetical protein